MRKRIGIIIILGFLGKVAWAQVGVSLLDKHATRETKALYQFLHQVSTTKGVLFGHQDTDAYGVHWKGDQNRSDVKDVCGSHAAVHGWDLGNELEPSNIDSVPFIDIRKYIIDVYRRGGVNTISWHLDNPVTGGSPWSAETVVDKVLPGGESHHLYIARLDAVADFLNNLELDGVKVPVIFRPFHEHNGDWFWWGKGKCSEEEYRTLFRFTVHYLKDKKNLHHLIYAFSPDRSRVDLEDGRQSYLYGYPGDTYVDIIGLDNYMDVGVKWNERTKEQQALDFEASLVLISQLASEKRKVAALTETGLDGITNSKWFTAVLLEPVKNNDQINIAYALVWRNGSQQHHYAPYPGHEVTSDFLQFYNDPATLFEDDIQDVYESGGEVSLEQPIKSKGTIKKSLSQ